MVVPLVVEEQEQRSRIRQNSGRLPRILANSAAAIPPQ
jgi:hypothetical protein